jgi:hypothetical protein
MTHETIDTMPPDPVAKLLLDLPQNEHPTHHRYDWQHCEARRPRQGHRSRHELKTKVSQ